MVFATGDKALARLPIGTAGKFLQVNSGATAPEWDSIGHVDLPQAGRCIVSNAGGTTVSDATDTILTWDTEDSDPDGWHSTVTNPSRITVPAAGVYQVNAAVHWLSGGSANTTRRIRILVNGTAVRGFEHGSATNLVAVATPISATLVLAANDYVEIQVYQNSGGSRNIAGDAGSEHRCWFDVYRIPGAS